MFGFRVEKEYPQDGEVEQPYPEIPEPRGISEKMVDKIHDENLVPTTARKLFGVTPTKRTSFGNLDSWEYQQMKYSIENMSRLAILSVPKRYRDNAFVWHLDQGLFASRIAISNSKEGFGIRSLSSIFVGTVKRESSEAVPRKKRGIWDRIFGR